MRWIHAPRATLVVALATGLVAIPAEADVGERTAPRLELVEADSNMGFLVTVVLDATEKHDQHLVSLPFFFQEDAADSSLDDPCSGTMGDGVSDANDLLCSWWTSEQGSMVVSRWDAESQAWQSRFIQRDPVTGEIVLGGDWTEPLVPREAVAVSVSPPPGQASIVNEAIIAGAHDSSAPGQLVALPPGSTTAQFLLNVPYHTMYQRMVELLCGLEDVDWNDGDADGWPDTCEGGLFDDVTGSRVEVGGFDPSAPPSSPDGFVALSVRRDAATGELVFEGTDGDVSVAHAYLARIEAPHSGATFLSPHF